MNVHWLEFYGHELIQNRTGREVKFRVDWKGEVNQMVRMNYGSNIEPDRLITILWELPILHKRRVDWHGGGWSTAIEIAPGV